VIPLESVTGHYVTLELDGLSHRVYFEEAGAGIPLLCPHTAGAPPVFKGDLYYYSVDHDMSEDELASIDTSRCAVHLLTGDYDYTAPTALSKSAADRIPGASFVPMEGLGHFPMCEDPERFLACLLPVLEKIRADGGPA